MRYLALACDYDGTLASSGRVDAGTVAALDRLRESGRRLLLVTGRQLPDLQRVFPELDRFDLVVAENGALLHDPRGRVETPLAEPPPAALVDALRRRGVEPLAVGTAIVATWEPHETAVLEAIHELGLEYQVIFNKGAVMVLPSGVNKATGLEAALRKLGLSRHNVVGIGDAENDHAFLSACECGVAVANALPMLEEHADLVTEGARGAGVVEVVERLLADDLSGVERVERRRRVLLGTSGSGAEVTLPAYGAAVLVAGPSGSGKSTLATGVLERLVEDGYQCCLVDPEGDYDDFDCTVALGDPERPPTVHEIVSFLEDPGARSASVSLVGLSVADRPGFFDELLPALTELRVRTGRPHWLVLDEAHHLLPTPWDPARAALPRDVGGVLLVTVHPDKLAPAVLEAVDTVVAVGEDPAEVFAAVARGRGAAAPESVPDARDRQAVLWRPDRPPYAFDVAPARQDLRRHRRKYAEGDVGADRAFVFRGPEGALKLRARNLIQFLDLADGVDDATWLFHLERGDYSRWFGEFIKDPELGAEVRSIERSGGDAEETRLLVRKAVEQRYTLPA